MGNGTREVQWRWHERTYLRNEPHGQQAQDNGHAFSRTVHCSASLQIPTKGVCDISCQLQHFPENWGIEKLIAMCVQEEDWLKQANGGELAFYVQHKKKNYQNNKRHFPPSKNQKESGPSKPPQHNNQKNWENFPVEKDQCLQCKERGHYKRDCPQFLEELLRNSEDTITFIDKSLYLSYDKSTWWIDSGATVHVANSLQKSHMRRTLPRGARRIKVANGVEVEVETIAEFHLELHSGFILCRKDVLYVPSLQ